MFIQDEGSPDWDFLLIHEINLSIADCMFTCSAGSSLAEGGGGVLTPHALPRFILQTLNDYGEHIIFIYLHGRRATSYTYTLTLCLRELNGSHYLRGRCPI